MSKRKVVLGLAAFVLITFLVGQSLSGAGGRGGQRPVRGGAQRPQRGDNTSRMQRDPQQMQKQMQKMMIARMKSQLEIEDEKWETVQPLLSNAMQLAGQLYSVTPLAMYGMPGGMGGRRMGAGGREMGAGGRGGPGGQPEQGRNRPEREGQAPTQEKSDLQNAYDELQELLKSGTAESDDVETKLAAYREARTNVKEDLTEAQEALKVQLTTPKQQAVLVLAGLLE